MQIEGFWYYLFTGVFEAATIHYAVAKIVGLAFGDMRIRRENGVSRCPFGNGCSETVMVNGQCHWKWSVNYLLFGWMAKLCDCPKERMSKLIRAWKTIKPKDYGKINNAVSFAEWAYDGFPDGGCWKKRNSVIANLVTVTRTFISAPNGPIMQQGMAQGDKRFVMSNHFVKGFAVGFGLGVILMVVAVVSYFS